MYDIVGDIHGHASRLAQLLERLGYAQDAQSWHHPARQLIFVGDFIDRGPEQVETYRLVRAMIDRVACVDSTVTEPAPAGKLTAYRWAGEVSIKPDGYVWV